MSRYGCIYFSIKLTFAKPKKCFTEIRREATEIRKEYLLICGSLRLFFDV